MSAGLLYLIECRINGKRYYGITARTLAQRWAQHVKLASGTRSQLAIHRAMRKHGVESFQINQVDLADTWEELCAKERAAIALFDTVKTGYNMTSGGEGIPGWNHSPETRQKISEIVRPRMDATVRAKISATNKGRVHSQEFRAAQSARQLGRKYTDQARANMSAAQKGHPTSPETKAKIGAANRNPNEDRRARLRAGQQRRLANPQERQRRSDAARNISNATRLKMSQSAKRRRHSVSQSQLELL